MRTWDDPNERAGALAALMTQSHPQHEAALYNLFSALESTGEPDYLRALDILTSLLNAKRDALGIRPIVPLSRFDEVQNAARDLELQRDCLMRAVANMRRAVDEPLSGLLVCSVADATLAYCALTPTERKHDADERAALDEITLDNVEEIPY